MSDGNTERRHVFISHHHKDDAGVDGMTKLLGNAGCDIRNSSIRALRPENQARMKNGMVKDETIRRWLRAKISWAGAVVVLIGKETHTRRWVNWEIQEAMRQGKRIIGVWEHGGTEADLPPSLKDYADAVVGWQADRILNAIDGQIVFDVFLAHNSRDKPAVRAIADALMARGLRPWLDERELVPGRSWQDALFDALERTKAIAVLIGEEGGGPWQMLELRAVMAQAAERGLQVIPVLLPGVLRPPELPLFLRDRIYVDFSHGISQSGLDRLQWGITGIRPAEIQVPDRDDESIELVLCFLDDDRAEVKQIAEQLKQVGIRSWPDDWSLSPEESRRRLLSRNLKRINALAVFAGNGGGPWGDDQVESFVWESIEAEQLVIPVILPSARRDPKFPIYLRRKEIIDFRKSDPDPVPLLVSLLADDRKREKGSRNG